MDRLHSRGDSCHGPSPAHFAGVLLLCAIVVAMQPIAWISRRLSFALALTAAFYFAISSRTFPLALALGLAGAFWAIALLSDLLNALVLRRGGTDF